MITDDMFHKVFDIPFMTIMVAGEDRHKPLLVRVCGFCGESATIRKIYV